MVRSVGAGATPIKINRTTPLTVTETLAILEKPALYTFSGSTTMKPESGEVFVYSYRGQPFPHDEWRRDGLTWLKQSRYSLKINKKDVIVKMCQRQKIEGETTTLQRHAYVLPNEGSDEVLVHYLTVHQLPPSHTTQLCVKPSALVSSYHFMTIIHYEVMILNE
jgi:hypothetical protein